MAQGSRQIQSQAQQQIQTLSPQQILVVKLLELPAVELEDRVHAELLENPALEEGKEEGIKAGEKKKAIEIAKGLLDILSIEIIAQKTGLTVDEVKALNDEVK